MLAPKTPGPTPTATFRTLCERMHAELKAHRVPTEEWQSLEAQGLAMLNAGIFVDRHVLRPALFMSGSIHLAKAAYARTDTDTWARYMEGDRGFISFRALDNLTAKDVAWFCEIGLERSILSFIMTQSFQRDDPELFQLLVRITGKTEVEVMEDALFSNVADMPSCPNLAPIIAKTLRHMLTHEDGRHDLSVLLEGACMVHDLRSVAMLLAADFSMRPDGAPRDYTEDKAILSLFDPAMSNHQRLQISALEPDIEDILRRPPEGPFFGLTPTKYQQKEVA